MTKKQIKEYVTNRENCINMDISYRGGMLKINVSSLFPKLSEQAGESLFMGAYQNYLGGGMAGAIVGGANFSPDDLKTKKDKDLFFSIKEECKRYFYALNNGGGDDYMQENVTGKRAKKGYFKNQTLPVSGY